VNDRAGLPKQRWWTISNLTKVTRNYSGTRITCRLFVNLAMTERLPRKAAGRKREGLHLLTLGVGGINLYSLLAQERRRGFTQEFANLRRGVKALSTLKGVMYHGYQK